MSYTSVPCCQNHSSIHFKSLTIFNFTRGKKWLAKKHLREEHFRINLEANPIFESGSSSKTTLLCWHSGHRRHSNTEARMLISMIRNPSFLSDSSSVLSSQELLDFVSILRTDAGKHLKLAASTCSLQCSSLPSTLKTRFFLQDLKFSSAEKYILWEEFWSHDSSSPEESYNS